MKDAHGWAFGCHDIDIEEQTDTMLKRMSREISTELRRRRQRRAKKPSTARPNTSRPIDQE